MAKKAQGLSGTLDGMYTQHNAKPTPAPTPTPAPRPTPAPQPSPRPTPAPTPTPPKTSAAANSGIVGSAAAQRTDWSASSSSSSKSGSGSSKSSGGSGGSKSSGSSGSSGGSSSSSAGRSDYYNMRGDEAREYQTWLNSQGAGLDVDGIWGKKTEAAYQQNKDAFEAWKAGQASGGSAGAAGGGGGGAAVSELQALLGQYQLPSYSGRSEAELRAEAEAQYQAQYNADKLAAEQRNAAYQQSIQQQIDSLRRTLEESQAATQRQYELNGNSLQRMLTKRGMGRSTYAGDVAQNNAMGMSNALAKLLSDYQHNSGQLSAQGALYQQQTADALAQMLRDKSSNVSSAYNKLLDQEYERRLAAQQNYNQIVGNLQSMLNDKNLTQQQLAESIRQFDAQLAENRRQFNASLAG